MTKMTDNLAEFLKPLDREDREGCVELVRRWMDEGSITVFDLYTRVLTPSLNGFECKDKDRDICVWKEHVRSSIVRTVVENCYTQVVRESRKRYPEGPKKGSVVVLCPSEEYHEIGARMVSDIFILNGFDSTFVGANTPREDIVAAIRYTRPRFVAMSISSFYNLVAARNTISELKVLKKRDGLDFKVLVGGRAFTSNPDAWKDIGADGVLKSVGDIAKLGGK